MAVTTHIQFLAIAAQQLYASGPDIVSGVSAGQEVTWAVVANRLCCEQKGTTGGTRPAFCPHSANAF